MPTIELTLRNGTVVEVDFPHMPTPQEIDKVAAEIERQLGIAPPPKPQPTQAQQLAGALRGTLQRGWNWLRSKLGLKSPEERAAEIAGPALANRPEALQEMARIEAARRQASSLPAMLRDAAIAPGNLAAERRYGSALKSQKAQASTGSQMEQVGTVTQLGNLLGLPQRGAVAWAKQVASKRGAQGSKYADSGEAFMDAAEWGALLEDLAPFLPKPVRQALAVPMDIVLDPLVVVTPAKVATALGPIASKLPGAAKAGELVRRSQYAVLASLHPTAAAALEGVLQRYARQGESLWDVARRQPWATVDLYRFGQAEPTDLLGLLQRGLQNARSDIDIQFNWANALALPEAAKNRLPAYVFERAQREATQAAMNYAPALQQYVAYGARDIRDILQAAENIMRMIAGQVGNNPWAAAATAESLRRYALASADPSLWERALGWWKRTVTSFNLPAGAVRNFLGNFLAHYLANEPLKLSPRPFAELLKDAFGTTKFTRAGDIGADVLKRGEPPKQALARVAQALADKAGEIYSGADKLAAAILAKLTDKPVEHFLISENFRLPERIEWLSRVGLVPFATWPSFIIPRLAKGFMENPARWHRAGMALQSIGARESDNNLYVPMQDNKAVNIEPFLPLSPYMFSASEGDLPELLARWPAISFARDVSDALAGAPAKPAALSTTNPIANAAVTTLNYALPPTFWNLLRLARPQWFADIPRSPLSPSDYLWRLMGVGIVRDPAQYSVIRRRRELEKLRRLMRRVGVRATQMNEQTGE
jgi:hypothetical protein